MPIRITEIEMGRDGAEYPNHRSDNVEPSVTGAKTFKVAGTLLLKDAELLERICREVYKQTGRRSVIELSDICFLDSASARILCRMKQEQEIEIKGMNLFIKKVMELTEDCSGNDLRQRT